MSILATKIFFTQFEKELILKLTQPHLHIIESKETNGVTSAKKTTAFDEITRQFNSTDGVYRRTAKQIRQCYQNLKKKLRRESTVIQQEQRKTGGGVPQQTSKLSSFEILVLAEPMLTQPLSTMIDSDQSSMDVLKSEDQSTSDSDPDHSVCPTSHTPSYSASATPEDLDTASANCYTSDAARVAACMEDRHSQTPKNIQKEEKRKQQQAENDKKEQLLRLELIQEQIRLAHTKLLLREKLLELVENPNNRQSNDNNKVSELNNEDETSEVPDSSQLHSNSIFCFQRVKKEPEDNEGELLNEDETSKVLDQRLRSDSSVSSELNDADEMSEVVAPDLMKSQTAISNRQTAVSTTHIGKLMCPDLNPSSSDDEKNRTTATGLEVTQDGEPASKKLKGEEASHIEKGMDEVYLFLKKIANIPKETNDESRLFCDLLCLKLRALDENIREVAMHEIHNLMFNFKKC